MKENATTLPPPQPAASTGKSGTPAASASCPGLSLAATAGQPRPPLLAATAGQPRPPLLAYTAGQPRPPPLSATTGLLLSPTPVGPRPLLAPPASGAPPQLRTVAATVHLLPHPPPLVPDMFCPDSQYLTGHIIPQLDGPSHLPDDWSCKCCCYETFFDIEEQLDHHHEAHLMRYEECNICFTGHVWKSR